MRTEYKFEAALPYSLHDMRVSSIRIIDDDLHFTFENGIVKLSGPCNQVNGTMTLEKIDQDFCTVFLLSKNGKCGKFQGQKMELARFLSKYDSFSFEIVDELYGYHQVCYGGFLSLPECSYLIEIQITVYYNGSIVYNTEEM